jgi:hypothetical protein
VGGLSQITLPNGSTVGDQNYNWQVPTSIQTPGATEAISVNALQRPMDIEVKNNAIGMCFTQYLVCKRIGGGGHS